MHPSVRDIFYNFSTKFEGDIPWMYLDIKGLVTVGVGNLIDSSDNKLIDPVSPALAVPFEYDGQPGSKATSVDIRAAWNTVKARNDLKTRGASAFKSLTNLRITSTSTQVLVNQKLLDNEIFLKRNYFSQFDSWPADAQLGVLSMAWAMGAGFPAKYPKFTTACQSEDWDTAATQCDISTVGNPGVKPRNDANRILFSNAARVRQLGYQPEVLYYRTVLFQDSVFNPFDPVLAIEAALEGQEKYLNKVYFFKQNRYIRYNWETDQVDFGYPQPLSAWNFPAQFVNGIDAALNGQDKYAGKAYFFKGDQYLRYDWKTDQVESGYPQPIAAWNFPSEFQTGIDAAINGQGKYVSKAYFFKGDKYLRYDWKTDQVDPGYPQLISVWNFSTQFQSYIAAALNSPGKRFAGKAYFFKDSQYLRYDWKTEQVDSGYPLPTQGNW